MGTAPPAVLAGYADGDRAGRAIERLPRHGVDARRIHVVDIDEPPPLDRHAQRTTDAGTTDAGTTGRVVRRFGRGLAVGAAVGAVVGAVVLLAVAPIPAPTALVAGGLAGAAAGAGPGAPTGLRSVPGMSHAWERAFSPHAAGGVVVAIEAAGGDESLDRLASWVTGTEAVEVRRTTDLDAAEQALTRR